MQEAAWAELDDEFQKTKRAALTGVKIALSGGAHQLQMAEAEARKQRSMQTGQFLQQMSELVPGGRQMWARVIGGGDHPAGQ